MIGREKERERERRGELGVTQTQQAKGRKRVDAWRILFTVLISPGMVHSACARADEQPRLYR